MTSEAIAIREADDPEKVIEVMTLAFLADPVARWVYPEEQQFLRYFPQFVRIFAAKSVEHRTAYCTDGYVGVAVWMPPGVFPDQEAFAALFDQQVSNDEPEQVAAFMEEMGRQHPHQPHWYLPLIGVVASHRRQGIGAALMAHTLNACDRDGAPAYLEATSAESTTLYARHGFRQIGTIQAGRSPTMYPMLRDPPTAA